MKVDLQREGELIDMKTDGPRIASAYSLREIKLEVSLVSCFYGSYTYFYQFLFIVQVILCMTLIQRMPSVIEFLLYGTFNSLWTGYLVI
jgi:hypothetical protein